MSVHPAGEGATGRCGWMGMAWTLTMAIALPPGNSNKFGGSVMVATTGGSESIRMALRSTKGPDLWF